MSYVSVSISGDTIALKQLDRETVRLVTTWKFSNHPEVTMLTRSGNEELTVEEVLEGLQGHGPCIVERGFGQDGYIPASRVTVVDPTLEPYGKYSIALTEDFGVGVFITENQKIYIDQSYGW